MTTEKRIIEDEQITEPSMSEAPRRVSLARSLLVAALVLAGLGFASAVYFDNSDGSLRDAEGIIADDAS